MREERIISRDGCPRSSSNDKVIGGVNQLHALGGMTKVLGQLIKYNDGCQ